MYHTQSFKVVDMITKAEEKYYMEALSDTQPKDIHVVGTLLSKQETAQPKDMFSVVGTLLSKQETALPNISDSVELSNKFVNFFSEKMHSFEQA